MFGFGLDISLPSIRLPLTGLTITICFPSKGHRNSTTKVPNTMITAAIPKNSLHSRIRRGVKRENSLEHVMFSVPENAPCKFSKPLEPVKRRSSKEYKNKSNSSTPVGSFLEQRKVVQGAQYWINQFRLRATLPALSPCPHLNEYATKHAERMAAQESAAHSVRSAEELQENLMAMDVAENVATGANLNELHVAVTEPNSCSRANLLGDFIHMGVGVARGKNGQLYMCQVFRG